MKGTLSRVVLAESLVFNYANGEGGDNPQVELNIESARYNADGAAVDSAEAFTVTLTLELALLHPSIDDVLCDLSATFRLTYAGEPVLDPELQRRFCSLRALRDAWPYWRSFVLATMPTMGFDPAFLPASPFPQLRELAAEAFTLEPVA